MGYKPIEVRVQEIAGVVPAMEAVNIPMEGRDITSSKVELLSKLIKAGDDHAKVARGIICWIDIQMQAGFMIELDTYNIGTTVLSTSSSMHNELRDMKGEELAKTKQEVLADKYYHRSFLMSYQTLRRVYLQRRTHRHPDWKLFCTFIEGLPNFGIFIYPEGERDG